MDNGVPPTDERADVRAGGATAAAARSARPTDPRREGTTGASNGNGARNGNSARNGQSRTSNTTSNTTSNGNGAKKKTASKSAKRGQQASRVHAPPAPRVESAAVALAVAPEAPATAPIPVVEPAAAVIEVVKVPVVESPVVESPNPPAVVVPTEARSADVDEFVTPSTSPDSAFASADLAELLTPDTTERVPFLLPPILPAEPSTGDTVTVPVVSPLPAPEFSDTDGTDGLPSLLKPKKPARALKAPVVRQRRRPRVRRVTRVVRHVDTWSVFKVALVFNMFLYGVLLTAGVLLWQVAQNTGTVDNIERFFESFGWQTFELKGGEIFHNSWIAGLFLVVGLTGGAVLMATLFNLIADLVGGIRVSVLEEEVVEREQRGTGWRRSSKRVVIPEDPPQPA